MSFNVMLPAIGMVLYLQTMTCGHGSHVAALYRGKLPDIILLSLGTNSLAPEEWYNLLGANNGTMLDIDEYYSWVLWKHMSEIGRNIGS